VPQPRGFKPPYHNIGIGMAQVLKIADKIVLAGRRLSIERYSVRVGDKKVIRKRFRILLPEDYNHIWDYIYKNNMRVDIIVMISEEQPQEQVVEEVEQVVEKVEQQESKSTGNATK